MISLAEKPFKSIQGEGKTQGVNSLFIRFTDCNLRCNLCDSKHTWKKDGAFEIELEDLISVVKDNSNIVFTGGEPLLSNNLSIIKYIIEEVPDNTYEIETNGTISLSDEDETFFKLYSVLFNISPKGNFFKEGNTEPLLLNNDVTCIVKFLYEDDTDMRYIESIVAKYELTNNMVWVQPKGIYSKDLKKTIVDNFNYIISKGYNISIRSHIFLFENKKEI